VEAASGKALLDRLRHRALSTFELMAEDDIHQGFDAMERAVAEARDSSPILSEGDLLVLGRE
jgi:hypothetical protein